MIIKAAGWIADGVNYVFDCHSRYRPHSCTKESWDEFRHLRKGGSPVALICVCIQSSNQPTQTKLANPPKHRPRDWCVISHGNSELCKREIGLLSLIIELASLEKTPEMTFALDIWGRATMLTVPLVRGRDFATKMWRLIWFVTSSNCFSQSESGGKQITPQIQRDAKAQKWIN